MIPRRRPLAHSVRTGPYRAQSPAPRPMASVRRFLAERCSVRPGMTAVDSPGITPVGQLYRAYTAWCPTVGARPASQDDFRRALEAAGVRTFRAHVANAWCAVGVKIGPELPETLASH